jgi:hypothetical protein
MKSFHTPSTVNSVLLAKHDHPHTPDYETKNLIRFAYDGYDIIWRDL